LRIFNSKGQCSLCHEGWNFTMTVFTTPVFEAPTASRSFASNIPKMMHAFKPGLREIERRSPYMHDGSIATLEEVVEHYDGGGTDRPAGPT